MATYGGGSFVLRIELGNDAMRTADDVSRTLTKIAARLRGRDWDEWTEKILDDNGNSIGNFTLSGAFVPDEEE